MDIAADTPYDELAKYYASRLWRKVRVYKRPVNPWDAPIIDNKPNVPLPQLFIEPNQLDKTRVDLLQKCKYNVDETLPENDLIIQNNGETVTQFPVFECKLIETQMRQGEKAVCVTNARWPGAVNIVYGMRMNKYQVCYFGDGVGLQQIQQQQFAIPEMCEIPFDLEEE